MKSIAIPEWLKPLMVCLAVAMNLNCKSPADEPDDTATAGLPELITYLALGDSYTIGESVEADERFPARLGARLELAGTYKLNTRIIARTGWTTGDLANELQRLNVTDTFSIVSLLIGVNNQYQGRDTAEYASEFADLLKSAVTYAGNRKKRVVVISIPDYGYTPFGESRQEYISGQIDNFNAINKRITASFGIAYVDITPVSRSRETGLIAADGLHPSAKQYEKWVDRIEPVIKNLLVH